MVSAEINPDVIYDDIALCELLGVKKPRLTRAANEGLLRSSQRLGKRFFRGAWVIQYLDDGMSQVELAEDIPNE